MQLLDFGLGNGRLSALNCSLAWGTWHCSLAWGTWHCSLTWGTWHCSLAWGTWYCSLAWGTLRCSQAGNKGLFASKEHGVVREQGS